MFSLKKTIKGFFIATKALPLLDKINFYIAFIKNYLPNKEFRKQNPDFKLPPDYYLYETYLLDYRQYKEDGELTAKEITEWTKKYLPEKSNILEWGCGVSRIIRHFPHYINNDTYLYACDINKEMINWNECNINRIEFSLINYTPPTPYSSDFFNLVFALSVFTHIESSLQQQWIDEIYRILKPTGIFLFTTHGRQYYSKLNSSNLEQLIAQGSFTISYPQKGHRMMSTYNTFEGFKKQLEKKFQILEYYNGQEHISKAGGQDLWIVQKC